MGKMIRTARILGLCAAVMATACGSSGGNSPTPTTGMATFGGDASGTLTVYVIGSYDPQTTSLSLSILSTAPGSTTISYPNFGFEAHPPGMSLQTGTFGTANTVAQTDYINQTMETWGQFSGSNPFGTFSLTLSSVGSSSSSLGITYWYNSNGTLSATMVPANGNSASGDVSVSVNF
jgi:hypothetical protein